MFSGPPPIGLTWPLRSFGRLVRHFSLPAVVAHSRSPCPPCAKTRSPTTVGEALGPLFHWLPFQKKVGPIFSAHFSFGFGLVVRSRAMRYSSAPRAPIR